MNKLPKISINNNKSSLSSSSIEELHLKSSKSTSLSSSPSSQEYLNIQHQNQPFQPNTCIITNNLNDLQYDGDNEYNDNNSLSIFTTKKAKLTHNTSNNHNLDLTMFDNIKNDLFIQTVKQMNVMLEKSLQIHQNYSKIYQNLK